MVILLGTNVDIMKRQELEITLSRNIQSFVEPKFRLEQYQTPPRVAANLLHRANELGDIDGKSVIDICAGTGILGIGAALLGGYVTCIEIDPDAIAILKQNVETVDADIKIEASDIFEIENVHADTVFSNPPFGIQQKTKRDLEFIVVGMQMCKVGYFILDGSPSNFSKIPDLLQKRGLTVVESYKDEFPLNRSYPWHKLKRKIIATMVIRVIHS